MEIFAAESSVHEARDGQRVDLWRWRDARRRVRLHRRHGHAGGNEETISQRRRGAGARTRGPRRRFQAMAILRRWPVAKGFSESGAALCRRRERILAFVSAGPEE